MSTPNGPNKILHCEPNKDWQKIVAAAFKRYAPELALVLTETVEAALEAIADKNQGWAGVLTAYKAGGLNVVMAAQNAGVPKLAILTGKPSMTRASGINVTTFNKDDFDGAKVAGFFSASQAVE